MKHIRCRALLLLGFSLFFGCTEEDSPANDETTPAFISGNNELKIDQTIDEAMVSRTVFIKYPQNFDTAKTYPLVFVFHGSGGSGSQFLNQSKLNEFIEKGDFIGVYPNGHSNDGSSGGYWNLGSEATTADDVAFVNLIVQQLERYPELDTSNMYALGVSNGAGMVNLLGKSTTHFKAIAPLFSQQSTSTGNLAASAPLSVFQVNGEIDNLIPLSGGSSPVGVFLSAQKSALNWAIALNCNNIPEEATHVWGNTGLRSYTYSSCDFNHEIKYFIAAETAHGWQDKQAATHFYSEVWSFFQQH